jgi:hypothetical protein
MKINCNIAEIYLCFVLMATMVALVAVQAQTTTVKPGEQNLALGRPYTLEPSPNSEDCKDPDDLTKLTQLTDGHYTKGHFWTQKSTVGWVNARPAIITIDLGSVQSIGGVSYNTAAGVAGVEWPESITVLASDDGMNFYLMGELTSLSAKIRQPPSTGYAVHCFRTRELKAHGRYVAFLVVPSGPFTFVDEIEVYKGQEEFLEVPFQGGSFSSLKDFFRQNETRLGIERGLRDDLRVVREAAIKLGLPSAATGEFAVALAALERELLAWPLLPASGTRAIMPLNSLHEHVFQAQARLWRTLNLVPFTIWSAEPYGPLSLTQPPPVQAKPAVSMAMMQNEFRAGAFNIANAGDTAALAQLQIVGLPGGTNPPYISVHDVLWTDTKSGLPIAAALPGVSTTNESFSIKVFSGLTKQVWFTFHPTNIPPGSYSGTIRLAIGNTNLTVPLSLRIYPLRFPDSPTLYVGGWDHTDSDTSCDIGTNNLKAVIAHLRERFINSPWGNSATLPSGKYDAAGNLIAEPEMMLFDRWLARWPNARQYCVFVNGGDKFDNSKMGTPEFNKKVGAWIRFWAKHAQQRGLDPHQLILLLVDEPSKPVQDEVILAWAKAIHAANTGVKVWEDSSHKNPSAANQEMMAACDVLCPNRVSFLEANQRYRDYYAKRREQGTELAFYSCSGPSTLLDPYSYYRLQAWSCWQYGAKSSYFWAFCDAGGGSSWNEYSAKGNTYVPFFLDATSVTPGKQMEALREGVEDYEYLVMLRGEIAKAEKSAVKGSALDRAKKLLSEAPSRVCDAPGANALKWAAQKDRTVADKVRIEILETLTALQGAGMH